MTDLTTKRLPDWPTRYSLFMLQHRRMAFAWGTQDCCQFARKGVIILRGRDPAKGLGLRRYKTAHGALSQLKRLGGLESLPVKAGLEEIRPAFAQRGDLILGEVLHGELGLGVCNGLNTAYAGKDGLVFLPTLEGRRAWRV